jgi:hypothetical protein
MSRPHAHAHYAQTWPNMLASSCAAVTAWSARCARPGCLPMLAWDVVPIFRLPRTCSQALMHILTCVHPPTHTHTRTRRRTLHAHSRQTVTGLMKRPSGIGVAKENLPPLALIPVGTANAMAHELNGPECDTFDKCDSVCVCVCVCACMHVYLHINILCVPNLFLVSLLPSISSKFFCPLSHSHRPAPRSTCRRCLRSLLCGSLAMSPCSVSPIDVVPVWCANCS